MKKDNEIKKVNILGTNVACVDMKKTLELISDNLESLRGKYICVSNVHTTIMAHEDKEYNKVQNSSYLSLPDGKPLSIVGKKRGFEIDRVTGPDLMEEIFKISEERKYKHYFYGNTKDGLDKFVNIMQNEYPNISIVGYEPSVFRELSEEENKELLDRINVSNADFIWIALGAPRQEIFMYKNREQVNGIMIGIGGAMNVLSGVSPRAPKWMQNLSLEWLFRLLNDPKRLWRRYLVTNTKFLLKAMIK